MLDPIIFARSHFGFTEVMQAQEVDYKISFDYLLSSSSDTPVTAEDWHVLCLWSYQMMDSLFSNLSRDREIACIGMSYLDCFMATSSKQAKVALCSRYEYRLATLACLVLALKNGDFVADVMCHGLYTNWWTWYHGDGDPTSIDMEAQWPKPTWIHRVSSEASPSHLLIRWWFRWITITHPI